MGRLPWMKFYSHDWQADPAVRSVSLAARGLWIDMLCTLWDEPDRGISSYCGGKTEAKAWAKVVGARFDFVGKLISELENAGVFSRLETDGRIFCRRMVREELTRKQHREYYHRNKHEFGQPENGHSDNVGADIRQNSDGKKLEVRRHKLQPPPSPPVPGGVEKPSLTHDDLLKDEKNYSYMPWGSGHIVIKTGRHKRLFSKGQIDALAGSSIEHVVDVIRGRGFWAEVYNPNGATAAP